MSANKTIELPVLHRSFDLKRDTLNKEKRTVSVCFSSETPVERYFGKEILDHKITSVRQDRLKGGISVLLEHDPNQRCGITESANITGKEGMAEVRFAKTDIGNRCLEEVEDGTLRFVSVGYRVHKFQYDEDEEEYRAIDWEPLEISFVAIPADPTASVRSGEILKRTEIIMSTPAVPAVVTKEDFSRELETGREILSIVMQYQRTHPAIVEAGDKAIKDKTPIQDFLRQAMEITKSPAQPVTAPVNPNGPVVKPQARTVGELLVTNESYRNAVKSGNLKGINVNIDGPTSFRATFNAQTEGIAGSSGVNIEQMKAFNMLGQQPLFIADLFPQGTTSGDQIRIVRESTYTNAATRVAEGANKPEATLDLEVANFTVEKTAVFLNVTDEMLSDFEQAQSFVNGRLSYMVQSLEDQQLLSGSGSSQITGILNTTGIQTISGAVNTVDAFLKAKSYVEGANGAGFATADAYVINSLDWLSIRLTKDSNGQYLFGGPGYSPYGVGGYSNVGNMWGIPVVSTVNISQGTALTGSFRMGAQIFRKQGLVMKTTNAHASNFIANIVTILAEQRMGFPVYLPNKFCAITAIPAAA